MLHNQARLHVGARTRGHPPHAPRTPYSGIRPQAVHRLQTPAAPGVEIANKGAIRFVKRGPQLTGITLAISYEVPDILAPFANVGQDLCCGRASSSRAKLAQLGLGTAGRLQARHQA